MTGPGIGSALIIFAFLATLFSFLALLIGDLLKDQGEKATNVGYVAAMVASAVITAAIVVLAIAFLREDLTFQYVAQNRPNVVSGWAWVYRISGVWAGREGSFLFWSWLLALFIAWAAWRRLSITDRLSNVALAVMNVVQGMFLMLLMLEANSPFLRVVIQGTLAYDPASNQPLFDTTTTFMSPLLQTWAMVIHPPTLFIGYAGLTIPFAYAIAALLINDPSKKWVELTDRVAVFSWLFLGAGIGLGAIWAYYELAFGGFWAWDPVENASLLPWLTGIGMIHSYTVYRRRGTFKRWSIVLTSVTFAMVIIGTWITRSGILAEGASVHTFGGDVATDWLLRGTVGLAILLTLGLLIWRRTSFASREQYEGFFTKEISYEFNNAIMLLLGVLIAYLTLTSAFPNLGLGFLPGAGRIIGRDAFDHIMRPIGIVYLFVMVICPVLSWSKTEGTTFWRRVKWPLAISGVLSALFVAAWWFQFYPNWVRTPSQGGGMSVYGWEATGEAIVGLLVAAMAIALPLWLFLDGARKRSAAKGEGFGTALVNILTKARTQSGGYLTHLGMGIILFGLIGSAMFVDRVQTNLPVEAGGTIKVQDYTFTLKDVTSGNRENGDLEVVAHFTSKRNGVSKPDIAPAMILPKQMLGQTDDVNSGRKEVALIHEPLRDVFVTFESASEQTIGIDVRVFPVISFTWGGFIILLIGSALAAWPKRAAA